MASKTNPASMAWHGIYDCFIDTLEHQKSVVVVIGPRQCNHRYVHSAKLVGADGINTIFWTVLHRIFIVAVWCACMLAGHF